MATSKKLNFSVVANNTASIEVTVLDQDGNGVDGTGMSIKWSWFIPNKTVTKSTAAGTITVQTSNPLVFTIKINATDTLGAVEGDYAHEAVTVDSSLNPLTIVNNDARLTWGMGFVRRQLTVQ